MIFATPIPLTVGQVHVTPNLKDSRGQLHHNVPVFVIREATREEWIADVAEQIGDIEAAYVNALKGMAQFGHCYYYEVHTD